MDETFDDTHEYFDKNDDTPKKVNGIYEKFDEELLKTLGGK